MTAIKEIQYSASWVVATDSATTVSDNIPAFITDMAEPCLKLLGNNLPVSAFNPDGTMPMGTTAYEKRHISDSIHQCSAPKCELTLIAHRSHASVHMTGWIYADPKRLYFNSNSDFRQTNADADMSVWNRYGMPTSKQHIGNLSIC